MGHARRVMRQSFSIAQTDGARYQLQRIHEPDAGLQTALELKRHHATKLAHLTLGQIVLGKTRQARKVNNRAGCVTLDMLSHPLRALAMSIHAQAEGLEATHHQVRVVR